MTREALERERQAWADAIARRLLRERLDRDAASERDDEGEDDVRRPKREVGS